MERKTALLGGSASSLACAIGTHDGRVEGGDTSEAHAIRTRDGRAEGGDTPETHANFSASSLPSQVTREQPETGVSEPQTTDSAEQCGWSDALRRALEDTHLDLRALTLEQIVPGCPDERVRSALDREYEAWMTSGERRAMGCHP